MGAGSGGDEGSPPAPVVPAVGLDLEGFIASRLGEGPATEVQLQALAVLVDADLSPEQRAAAFGAVLSSLLARLSPVQLKRFLRIAEQDGEAAALSWLGQVARVALASRGRSDRSGANPADQGDLAAHQPAHGIKGLAHRPVGLALALEVVKAAVVEQGPQLGVEAASQVGRAGGDEALVAIGPEQDEPVAVIHVVGQRGVRPPIELGGGSSGTTWW